MPVFQGLAGRAGSRCFGLPSNTTGRQEEGGDKEYRKLYIGEKTPTGGDLFAKRNDEKKVFLIPATNDTSFNRTTSTFETRRC